MTEKPKIQRSLRQAAADERGGMTLGELAAFVQEALRQDVPGDTVVKTTATWRQTIKRLEITG